MKAQTVLALDFGTVRIGCAVSYGTLAEPITVIANTPEVFEQILKLIETHAITQILVGISESTSAERARAFGGTVQRRTGLPVIFADETLSTHSARRKLREQHKVVKVVDHYAAAEFLQEWLDSQEM